MSSTAGEFCATCSTTHPHFAPCPDWRLKEMAKQREAVVTADLVERVARAIYLGAYAKQGGRWEANDSKEVWRGYARAAIAEVLREQIATAKDGSFSRAWLLNFATSHGIELEDKP